VVYLPHGDKVVLYLRAAKGPFTARWFNQRDGKSGGTFAVMGGQQSDSAAPDEHDWTLLLEL
jgi:hypothetical protein